MKLLGLIMLNFSAALAEIYNQNDVILAPKKTLKTRVLPIIVNHNSAFYPDEYTNKTIFDNAFHTFSKNLTIIFLIIWTAEILLLSE